MKRRDFLTNSAFLTLGSLYISCISGCKKDNDIIIKPDQITRRKFKNITLPLLGLGCLRILATPREEFQKMVDYCMEHGVNFFDTGFYYCDKKSEDILSAALQKYKREDYYIATKISPLFFKDNNDFEKKFKIQLERFKSSYIDFYLAHCIKDKESVNHFKEKGMYDSMCRLKEEGKIRYIGFSSHGKEDVLDRFTDEYKWDFCYIKVNYHEYYDSKTTKRKMAILEKKKIPIIAMEPMLGGRLATLEDEAMQELRKNHPDMTPVEFAMKWSASQNVVSILSGMNNLKHVKENISYYINFKKINDEDETARRISDIIYKNKIINCTYCGYCLTACKQNVDIVNIFKSYNTYILDKNEKNLKNLSKVLANNKKNSSCNRCMECCKICPQSLKIPDLIDKIYKKMDDFQKS